MLCECACANLSPFAGRSATDGPCVIRNDPGGWAAGDDEGSPPPRGDGHRAPWSPKQGTELISTAILRWSQERESLWSFGRMIATSFDRTAHSAMPRNAVTAPGMKRDGGAELPHSGSAL